MGFLANIGTWFTSGGDSVNKLTDAVVSAGDKLVFTEEERSDVSERQRELYFKFLEMARDETSIRSVTRRLLAFMVIGHWFLYLDCALVLYLTGRDVQAKAVFAMAQDMYWIVFAVASFYFGVHIIRGMRGRNAGTKDE